MRTLIVRDEGRATRQVLIALAEADSRLIMRATPAVRCHWRAKTTTT
jgi:hypothetical protein